MARRSPSAKIARTKHNALSIEDEIAHLRSLDLIGLQARWRSVVGRSASTHVPKHLLFGTLAYRIQADMLGDLDTATAQLLARAAIVESPDEVLPLLATRDQRKQKFAPGTVLTREWNGRTHRVMVVADGFAFEGKTYDSLSKVAFAITGTSWNGPRFFGLRARPEKGCQS